MLTPEISVKKNTLQRLKENSGLLAFMISLATITYSAFHRFVLDDAFISFRYAQHFASGKGLVWNLDGTRVEGYTNFLWTVLMSVSFPLGIDVILFSQIIGIFCAVGTLFAAYRLTQEVVPIPFAPLLTVLFLSLNFTFNAYITSGLETQLQTFLLTALVYQITTVTGQKESSVKKVLFVSLLSSLALLTRLDSAIVVGISGLYFLFYIYQSDSPLKQKVLRLSAYIIPAFIIVGGWLLWKFSFYGDIFPNTFYVRVSGVPAQPGGLMYLYYFLDSYLLIPALLLVLVMFSDTLSSVRNLIIFAIVIFWWCYVASVGGDFMEFRFFVPTLPLLILLIVKTISVISDGRIQIAVALTLIFGSFTHAKMFKSIEGIESIPTLQHWIQEQKWDVVGKKLDEYFSEQPLRAWCAVRPAGAIPFYSHLPTIDMLGLNDKWIARNGLALNPTSPGHQRLSPYQYLLDQKVNLVIGHPLIARRIFDAPDKYEIGAVAYFSIEDYTPEATPADASVIEIPLDSVWKVSVLYLTKNSFIDSVIARNNLKTIQFAR